MPCSALPLAPRRLRTSTCVAWPAWPSVNAWKGSSSSPLPLGAGGIRASRRDAAATAAAQAVARASGMDCQAGRRGRPQEGLLPAALPSCCWLLLVPWLAWVGGGRGGGGYLLCLPWP